jgi:ribosomal protein L11 methyltransferase (prmA)
MYFRYLELLSQPGVFIVRPETEVVAGAAIEAASTLAAPLVVDLCTGSGAIACALASEVPSCRVWAVELDPQAAALARVNAQKNHNVSVIEADATGPLTELAEIEGQVDVVVTNPPYVPAGLIEDSETASYDPPLALFGGGVDGLELPLKLIKRASSLLRVGGVLVMEHDPSQAEALVKAAKAAGFSQGECHQDLTGRQRYLQAVK